MTQAINFFTDDDNLSNEVAFDPWRKLASDWLFNFNSARTRDNYRRAILFFFRFVDLHPEAVSQSDVLRFRYIMEGENYREGTINQRLAAISSFFAAAIERGLRADNPANAVKRKAVNPYGKATFLEAEQDLQLLQAVDRNTAKDAFKNKVVEYRSEAYLELCGVVFERLLRASAIMPFS